MFLIRKSKHNLLKNYAINHGMAVYYGNLARHVLRNRGNAVALLRNVCADVGSNVRPVQATTYGSDKLAGWHFWTVHPELDDRAFEWNSYPYRRNPCNKTDFTNQISRSTKFDF